MSEQLALTNEHSVSLSRHEVALQQEQTRGQLDIWQCIDETYRPGCYCPGDCYCRYPWRANYCGCKAHQ